VVHELKTWPQAFQAIWDGLKCYEIRKADRDFSVGDNLVLYEWDQDSRCYRDRMIVATVTYMTNPGQWGLPSDLCVMSIQVKARKTCDPGYVSSSSPPLF